MTSIKNVSFSKTAIIAFDQVPNRHDNFIISGIPENSDIFIKTTGNDEVCDFTITDWEPIDCISDDAPTPIADFNLENGNGYHVISFDEIPGATNRALIDIEVMPVITQPKTLNHVDLSRNDLDHAALAGRTAELRHPNGSIIKTKIDESGKECVTPKVSINGDDRWSCFIEGSIPTRKRYADELSQGTVFRGINSEGEKHLLVKSYGPRAFNPETVDFTLELDRQWEIDESYPTYPLNTILKP